MNKKRKDKFNIERYDIYLNDQGKENIFLDSEEIGGSLFKRFMRADIRIFKDLINEIRNNPDCSYVTYANDLIKSGYTPKWISILEKNIRRRGYNTSFPEENDRTGTKLCNLFGVPTVYNIEYEDKFLSVDFISEGETFSSFYDMKCAWNDYHNTFDEWSTSIRKALCDYPKSQVDTLIEDFIESYLLRTYIFADSDFDTTNAGVLISSDGNIKLAPNFDFEFIDKGFVNTIAKPHCLKDDMQYIHANYPQILKKFNDKVENKQKLDDKENILLKTMSEKHYSIQQMKNIKELRDSLRHRMKLFTHIYNRDINKKILDEELVK